MVYPNVQVLTRQRTAGIELATCWSQVRRPKRSKANVKNSC